MSMSKKDVKQRTVVRQRTGHDGHAPTSATGRTRSRVIVRTSRRGSRKTGRG